MHVRVCVCDSYYFILLYILHSNRLQKNVTHSTSQIAALIQKVEKGMRPALTIVEQFQGKPQTFGKKKFPGTVRALRDKDDNHFLLSASNTAKLDSQNKGWVSAVRKHLGTQSSILLDTSKK